MESAFWDIPPNYLGIYPSIVMADGQVEAKEAKACALKMAAVVASRGNWDSFQADTKQCVTSWSRLKEKMYQGKNESRWLGSGAYRRFRFYFGCFGENLVMPSEYCYGADNDSSAYAKVKQQFEYIATQDAERYAVEWRKKIRVGDYAKEGLIIGFRENLVQVQQEWCNGSGGNCYNKYPFIPRSNLHPQK